MELGGTLNSCKEGFAGAKEKKKEKEG